MLMDGVDAKLARVWTYDEAKETWIQVFDANGHLKQPDGFIPFKLSD